MRLLRRYASLRCGPKVAVPSLAAAMQHRLLEAPICEVAARRKALKSIENASKSGENRQKKAKNG